MAGQHLASGLLAPIALALAIAAPAGARSAIENSSAASGSTIENGEPAGGGSVTKPAHGYLQCVPYARQVSGIKIFGDAHTWWGQAQGRYAKGSVPRVGAVMALRPHGNSHLGHVAAVSRIIDSRTVLIKHANWSERGKIENNVQAVDVSEDNDWSKVRMWYGPAQHLGGSEWPLYGFIYSDKPGKAGKVKPAKAAKADKRRSNDPIGDIIAGRYR